MKLGPRQASAVAVSLALMLLTPSAALANHTANCSENSFVTHSNGYVSDTWANHRYGVRAHFEGQGLDICLNPRPGEGSSSTAWVAIQGPPVPLGNPYGNIAQVGFGRCRPLAGVNCDGSMRDGYAYGRWSGTPGCSGSADKAPTGVFIDGPWSGAGTYSVTENGTNDFTLKTPSYTRTIHDLCWTNETVAVFGEALDFGDAIGGFSANKFGFSQKEFRTTAGGAWQALPTLCNGRVNAPNPPFKCGVNGSTLEIWTDR